MKVLGSETKDAKFKVHAVLSSVILAYVFTYYHVDLKPKEYEILLTCLKLPPDKEVCAQMTKNIDEFDDNTLRYSNVMRCRLSLLLRKKGHDS